MEGVREGGWEERREGGREGGGGREREGGEGEGNGEVDTTTCGSVIPTRRQPCLSRRRRRLEKNRRLR